MSVTPVSNANSSTSTALPASAAPTASSQQDRFLKLLVAQLANQDPTNPVSNAEITSQTAQISTVSGIEQLNQTIKTMTEQFGAVQAIQSANLIGRNVMVEGPLPTGQMSLQSGVGRGSFDLSAAADQAKVDVLNSAGEVIDVIKLGPTDQGRQDFSWDASKYTGSTPPYFRVSASFNGTDVPASALVMDKVISVGTNNGKLNIQLQGQGTVDYSLIKSFL